MKNHVFTGVLAVSALAGGVNAGVLHIDLNNLALTTSTGVVSNFQSYTGTLNLSTSITNTSYINLIQDDSVLVPLLESGPDFSLASGSITFANGTPTSASLVFTTTGGDTLTFHTSQPSDVDNSDEFTYYYTFDPAGTWTTFNHSTFAGVDLSAWNGGSTLLTITNVNFQSGNVADHVSFEFEITPVPEVASISVLSMAAVGLLARRRR